MNILILKVKNDKYSLDQMKIIISQLVNYVFGVPVSLKHIGHNETRAKAYILNLLATNDFKYFDFKGLLAIV